jgi:hypothetical protein
VVGKNYRLQDIQLSKNLRLKLPAAQLPAASQLSAAYAASFTPEI